MKTKHIFYSFAIVAALASCSQDNFEVAGDRTQDLSIRPELGPVELVEDAEVSTRFATGTGAQPVFADGDALGACIMDTPKYPDNSYNKNNPSANYTVVEYYSSNNAFIRTDGIWKVDQPMVEGNYLFYAPYNKKMQLRTPHNILVPAVQDASTEKKALDDFYKSGAIVRVGYQFLAAKGGVAQKPEVTMNDVFAYPQITIKNNFNGYLVDKEDKLTAYNGEVKVDSIRLVVVDNTNNRTASTDVVLGGQLSNGNVSTLMAAGGAWSKSPMETYTANLLATGKEVKNAGGNDRTAGFITTLKAEKRAIAQSGSEKFYAVMPAMETSAGASATKQLQANIYVTIGDKQYVISDATLATPEDAEPSVSGVKEGSQFASATETIKLIKGQKYPQEELNFEDGKLSAKASAGSILTIELKGGKAAGSVQVAKELEKEAATVKIANNTQFINFFKEQLNGTALVEEGATVSGNKFAFTDNTTAAINAELIKALSVYNNKGSLKINKSLVVENDVKATVGTAKDGYTEVTFTTADNVSYKIMLKTTSGGYTATDNVLVSGSNKSVHVTTGATWTISAATTAGNIRNDGTIVVAASQTLTPSKSFMNKGTLTLNGVVANTMTNDGLITVADAGASVVIANGTGKISAAWANKAATVKVAETADQIGVVVLGSTDNFNKDNVKTADAIAWVNAIEKSDNVTFSAEVLAEMKDINAVYATGASFPAATTDMKGKTLVMIGEAAKSISGAGIATSVVNNITILNTTNYNVNLSAIAANGTYTKATGVSAKIIADGESATWNGGKAE